MDDQGEIEVGIREEKLGEAMRVFYDEVTALVNRNRDNFIDGDGIPNGSVAVAVLAQVIGALCASAPPEISTDAIMESVAINMDHGMKRQRMMKAMAQVANKEKEGQPVH